MNRQNVYAALLTALLSLGFDASLAASAEPMVGQPEISAKIAHMKAKAKTMGRDKYAGGKVGAADELNESQTCGSVDIGSVTTQGKGRQPREVVVIVTGDVINTADCK